MAKFTIFIASFIALLFLVDASIYRTTIIADEEDPNQGQSDCRKQIDEQQKLRRCQEFIRQQVSKQGPRRLGHSYDGDVDDNQQTSLRSCCDQLKKLPSQCRCPGLMLAFEQQHVEGQIDGMEEFMGATGLIINLPSMCRLSPGECDFESPDELF